MTSKNRIPSVKNKPDNAKIATLFLSIRSEIPIPKPNKPVVNGNKKTSLGCRIIRRHKVVRYAMIPAYNERIVAIAIGKVTIALIRKPGPPRTPADCMIAASADRRDAATSFLVFVIER